MGGEKNDSNYEGNCTARHCLSGTCEISGQWIFVRLSVRNGFVDTLMTLFDLDLICE